MNDPSQVNAQVVRAPAWRPGLQVRVVPLASPLFEPERLARARQLLEQQGYRVTVDARCMARRGYLAGTDRQRAAALAEAFLDPDVDLVWALAGGYGTARTLERFDLSLLATHPKPVVGFSDVTTLHLALNRFGIVSFYGPVVRTLADATSRTLRALFGVLRGVHGRLWPADHPLWVITPGRAEGPLTGGCLSLVVASLGTPWEIETDGRILFLEDVDEEPYAIDRMLTQLRLSGKLQRAGAVVFGEWQGLVPRSVRPSFPYGSLSITEVLADRLGDLGIPVVAGYPIGHGRHLLTLPYGIRAELRDGLLSLLEPATKDPPPHPA